MHLLNLILSPVRGLGPVRLGGERSGALGGVYWFLRLLLTLSVVGVIFGTTNGRRSLVLALRSLWLHKLRSFLSVLGIIIGTGAVIALMAFGEGSMQDALEDIQRQGATNIMVRSVKPPDETSQQRRGWTNVYGITYDDVDRIEAHTRSTVTRMVKMRVFPQEVRRAERVFNGRIVATTPEYADVNKLELASGRFLTHDDDDDMVNVAVLGAATADRLFPFDDPIGQSVNVNQHRYRIVGVCRDRMPTGGSGGSLAAEDYNNDVYIPLRTCLGRFGERIVLRVAGTFSREAVDLHQVTLTVDADVFTDAGRDKVRATGEVIKDLMESYHLKKDFAITVPLDRLEEAERAKERYKTLLVFIAGISLIVGGIGIMNIMLATVTERTREIGIRRALGAKRRDITLQFLVEAVVQTTVGGLVGVGLGLGIALAVPPVSQWLASTNVPAKINVLSIFLSLGVAVGVGVAFGMYPARRAALLDPIEALRHESVRPGPSVTPKGFDTEARGRAAHPGTRRQHQTSTLKGLDRRDNAR